MTTTVIGLIGIAIMIAMFLTKMPIAYVMAIVGFVGFGVMVTPEAGLVLLSRSIYVVFEDYNLTTIPLLFSWGNLLLTRE